MSKNNLINKFGKLGLFAGLLALVAPESSRAAAGYADAVMADGPIAYYRFSDAPPIAVNSGTLGAAANGAYTGDATAGTQAPLPPDFAGFEASNTALQLDGNGDYVTVLNSLFNGRPVFTTTGWLRRNADQNNRTGLWGQNDIVELGYINNNTLEVWTDNGLHQSPDPTTNPFPNGEWAHIAIVSTGSPGTIKMYTNGVFAAERAHTLPADNAFPFNIGGGGVFDALSANGNYFNGQIDEVAVFDKVLSDAQIAAQYAAARTPITPFPNFVNVGGNAIGTASYDSATDALTIVGGGNDIWDQTDEFTYAYGQKAGDFDVQVRVESLTLAANWTKAGIMIRESLAEDSRMVFLRTTPTAGANDTKLAYRTGAPNVAGESGGQHEDPADQNIPGYPNAWLRVVRSGNVFSAHISADGTAWTQIASQDTGAGDWLAGGGAFREDVVVGLAVSRHSGAATATAVFKGFQFNAQPFTLLQASSRGNPNGILVSFSTTPDAATLVPGSFDVVGVTLTGVTPGPWANSYWLSTQDPLTEGADYSVACFSVTSGGSGPVNDTDTFTHGKGYEARAAHIGYNKEPVFGLATHEGRTHTQRGLYSPVWGSTAMVGNTFFEDPLPDTAVNERFTATIFGILNVTAAGDYQFACSSDDYGKLYLSSNEDPANKRLIAREPEWNGSRQYAAADRRGLQADLPQNTVRPNLTPAITLAAGTYYLEYVFNEGGGGNNGSVTWAPAGTAIDNGRDPIKDTEMAPSRYFNGNERGEFFKNLGAVSILKQPVSQTVVGGTPVSFSVRLDGTPAYKYQWRRNGQAIEGATGPTYTIPVTLAADDGVVFSCAVANEFSSAVSGPATLTVNIPTPPVLLSAAPDATLKKVTVKFDKRVQAASAQAVANYSIPGLTVESATVDASGQAVVLVTSQQAEGTDYALTVKDVKEVTGNNALSPNPTVVNFVSYAYAPGYVTKDYYLNYTAGVDAIAASQPAPSDTCLISLWELNEADQFENYAARISGWFVATETGPHVFFLATDDGGRLFLSTDENPANKVEIAREPVWASRREWTGAGGGGGRQGVTSASGGPQANISGAINLEAGKRYYMESFVQEGGGGDNMGVAVRLPSGTEDPINTTTRGIGALNLGTMVSPAGASVAITTEPADQSLAANAFATFTVGATGTSPLCGGSLTYQWYRNGQAIAGANGASLTLGPLVESQNGELYKVAVRVPGRGVTSREALLSVTAAQPLKVVGASGSANMHDVTITFDQVVDPLSAVEVFSYTSAQLGSTLSAVVNPGGTSVTVSFENAQAPGASYTVNVRDVLSSAGQAMSPAVVDVTFNAFVLSPGFLNLAIWDNIPTVNVAALTSDPRYPNSPDARYHMASFDTRTVLPTDSRENFGGRVDGFFIPPSSGNWILYLRSDDASELWMDLNDGAGLVKIQEETGCCKAFSALPTAPLALTGGTAYRVMGLYKEAGGGDYLQVAAKLETDTTNPDTLRPISGTSVATFVNGAGVSITASTQPADQTFLIIPATGAGAALLDESFTGGNGGFTATTPGAFSGTPFAYDAGAGSWQVNQADAEAGVGMTSYLDTPAITVTRAGYVYLNFSHRWSLEADYWDGARVEVSVNGGAYTAVPGTAFSAGGYNGTVRAGNSILQNQAAFTLTSANHQGPGYVDSAADLGFFNTGDTVKVRFVYGADTNTGGPNKPSWEITSVKLTDGNAPSTVTFTFGATAVVPGNANPPVFYQWYRNGNLIPGANGTSYTFAPVLADNGAKFSCNAYTLGGSVASREATLTVAQPNTPPTFACGPNQAVNEDAGAQAVAGWATDIKNNSIVRSSVQVNYDFSSTPAGVTMVNRVLDVNTNGTLIRDGLLKLTDAINGSQGGFLSPALPTVIDSFTVSFKLRIGGGTCCGATLPNGTASRPADGMSVTIGEVQSPLAFPVAAEEGAALGAGVVVAFDTWDNGGTDEAPAVDVKVGGAVIAFQSLAGEREGGRAPANALINDPATGQPLGFDTGTEFVPVRIHLDADGTLDVDFKGIRVIDNVQSGLTTLANARIAFGARTGGANANHWVDDVQIEAFAPDTSTGEAGQTVSFLAENDNPSLFSAQPAIAADGTLTYTPAPNAHGVANVTVRAQDSGGTANGGRDTSAPCTFTITVNGVCDAITANNDTAETLGSAPVTIAVLSNDSDNEGGLSIASVTQGAHGTVAVSGNNVIYTAGAGYSGTDTFTYNVVNACGSQASATVTVTVRADSVSPTAVIGTDALVDFSPDYEHPVLISCNWWNACLVLDGWTSSAADGGALTYLWFDELEPVPFDGGVVVTNCYEVGEHTLTLVVTDSRGLTGTDTKTIEVVTAPLAVELLIEKVNQSRVSRTVKRELVASLRAALASAKADKGRPTQTTLDAFEKKVRAKIADAYPEEARVWIKWSQAISAGMEKCMKPPRKAKDHWDKKKSDDKK